MTMRHIVCLSGISLAQCIKCTAYGLFVDVSLFKVSAFRVEARGVVGATKNSRSLMPVS
jgi:hypothetical protein